MRMAGTAIVPSSMAKNMANGVAFYAKGLRKEPRTNVILNIAKLP